MKQLIFAAMTTGAIALGTGTETAEAGRFSLHIGSGYRGYGAGSAYDFCPIRARRLGYGYGYGPGWRGRYRDRCYDRDLYRYNRFDYRGYGDYGFGRRGFGFGRFGY